jgi:hypothetical protein
MADDRDGGKGDGALRELASLMFGEGFGCASQRIRFANERLPPVAKDLTARDELFADRREALHRAKRGYS